MPYFIESEIKEKYRKLNDESKEEFKEDINEMLTDKLEEDKEMNIDNTDDYVKVERMLQESIEISKEAEEVQDLAEAGNLSDVKLKTFKAKANRYLTDLNGNTIISSGLQNDINLQAGLLNLKTDIKNAAISLVEIAKKAIANIIKFFADIFVRILTKTKDLEVKLDLINKHLLRSSNEVGISFSAFRSIFMQFEMVSLANGWDRKSPTVSAVFAEMVDLVNTMSTSKIPKISTAADSLIDVKDYVKENKTTLESELIDYFIKNDDRAKELSLSRDRVKVIRIARDRVDFAVFSEDNREVFVTYARTDKDPKVRLAPFEVTEKVNISVLAEALAVSIRALKGPLRNDTEKRIKSLKEASEKIVKEYQDATSDVKSPDEKTKWDILSRDIKNIWTVYPLIGNKSLLNLYSIIDKLLNWLISINKINTENIK